MFVLHDFAQLHYVRVIETLQYLQLIKEVTLLRAFGLLSEYFLHFDHFQCVNS